MEDVCGVAVHIAARVAASAGAGEVVVSGTVKDLVAGSGIDSSTGARKTLEGVPGACASLRRAGPEGQRYANDFRADREGRSAFLPTLQIHGAQIPSAWRGPAVPPGGAGGEPGGPRLKARGRTHALSSSVTRRLQPGIGTTSSPERAATRAPPHARAARAADPVECLDDYQDFGEVLDETRVLMAVVGRSSSARLLIWPEETASEQARARSRRRAPRGWRDLGFDASFPQRVLGLQRRDRVHRRGAAQRCRRAPESPTGHLAGMDQVGHRADCVLDRIFDPRGADRRGRSSRCRGAQAAVMLLHVRRRRVDRELGKTEAELGCDHEAAALAADRPAEQLLVHGGRHLGRVEERDAELDRARAWRDSRARSPRRSDNPVPTIGMQPRPSAETSARRPTSWFHLVSPARSEPPPDRVVSHFQYKSKIRGEIIRRRCACRCTLSFQRPSESRAPVRPAARLSAAKSRTTFRLASDRITCGRTCDSLACASSGESPPVIR